MTYVLVHVKHVWDAVAKRPVDKHRWMGAYDHPEDARERAVEFARDNAIVWEHDMPVHVWWTMSPEAQHPGREWWLSNEFGPNDKAVGNTFRIYKMEAV